MISKFCFQDWKVIAIIWAIFSPLSYCQMTVWIIKMEWCLPREIRIMTNGRMQIVQNNTLVRALHGGLWLSLCMQLQLWFTQSLPLGSLGKINTKLCKQHLWWYIFHFSNKWLILMDVKCNHKYLKKNQRTK